MHRRHVSLLILTAFLLSFSGVAYAGTQEPFKVRVTAADVHRRDPAHPKWNAVQVFAHNHGLKYMELLERNKNLRLHPHRLVAGALLDTNLESDPKYWDLWRYNRPGGDPSGPSLVGPFLHDSTEYVINTVMARALQHLDLMADMPDELLDQFRTQVQASHPVIDTVWSAVDERLVTWGMAFSGASGHTKPKYIPGDVLNDWYDANGNPIEWQLAAQWDPVTLRGDSMSYQLTVYLGCQNTTIIPFEAERETTVVAVAPPETTVTTPAPPETTAVPESTVVLAHNQYVADQVYWLVGEHWRDHGMNIGTNSFGGAEVTGYTSNAKRLGVRGRGAGGDFDMGRQDLLATDLNAGLVWCPYWSTWLRVETEVGGGWTATQRSYTTFWFDDHDTWHGSEHRLWVNGGWWYPRLLLINQNAYADLKFRNGATLRELSGQLTVTPGRLYAKASASRQIRKAVTRENHDGFQISFAADTMDVLEGRLGVRAPEGDWTVYGSYNKWWFYSPDYWSLREGVGIGGEWYPRTPSWRLEASVIWWTNTEHARWMIGDQLTDFSFTSHPVRYQVGIIVTPQHGVPKN